MSLGDKKNNGVKKPFSGAWASSTLSRPKSSRHHKSFRVSISALPALWITCLPWMMCGFSPPLCQLIYFHCNHIHILNSWCVVNLKSHIWAWPWTSHLSQLQVYPLIIQFWIRTAFRNREEKRLSPRSVFMDMSLESSANGSSPQLPCVPVPTPPLQLCHSNFVWDQAEKWIMELTQEKTKPLKKKKKKWEEYF